jgi:hypothetical protein
VTPTSHLQCAETGSRTHGRGSDASVEFEASHVVSVRGWCGRGASCAAGPQEGCHVWGIIRCRWGRRRSPATLPGYRRGCVPRNKGRRYPADPPRVEEIIAVMRTAGPGEHGDRIRALVVILWRAGLRINEALSLAETDLEPRRGSVLVRRGKGCKRREVGMDEWAWEHIEPWRRARVEFPVGPFFCVLDGRPVDGFGHRPGLAPNCEDLPTRPVSADASPPINSDVLMPLKWLAREYRYPSSSGSSDTRISA